MDTKTCTKCGETKTLDQFHIHKACSQGVSPECKECKKAWYRENYAKNGDALRAKAKARYWADPARRNMLNAKSVRGNRLRRTGWTPEAYNAAYLTQDGKCKICGKFENILCADHCHETKKTRDLLCASCNKALGHFRESVSIMRTAIDYVNRHSQE